MPVAPDFLSLAAPDFLRQGRKPRGGLLAVDRNNPLGARVFAARQCTRYGVVDLISGGIDHYNSSGATGKDVQFMGTAAYQTNAQKYNATDLTAPLYPDGAPFWAVTTYGIDFTPDKMSILWYEGDNGSADGLTGYANREIHFYAVTDGRVGFCGELNSNGNGIASQSTDTANPYRSNAQNVIVGSVRADRSVCTYFNGKKYGPTGGYGGAAVTTRSYVRLDNPGYYWSPRALRGYTSIFASGTGELTDEEAFDLLRDPFQLFTLR